MTTGKLTAINHQLILEPRELWWERNGVFNPAVVEINQRVYMLYRAVGADHISRFGLAISDDGEFFTRFDHPIWEGNQADPFQRLGIEDPRAVILGKEVTITYTAASVYSAEHRLTAPSLNTPGVPWRIRTMGLQTRDFRTFRDLGCLLPELDTKDSALFPEKINGQYWLIHRLVPSIYLSTSPNLRHWTGGSLLFGPQQEWESQKVGVACPPIKTEHGYLLFYHGVDKRNVYRVGAALLNLFNPHQVIRRTTTPLLTPVSSWEKHGVTSNVIFPTGSISRKGIIWLYFGGADRVVGLVKIPLETILNQLDAQTSPLHH